MNTAAAGGGQFNSQGSNIGFAIPIDNAVNIVSQIRTGNDTDKVHIGDRAMLGVQAQNVDGTLRPSTSGALVVGVQDGTGAAAAGLKQDDVIVSINGKTIADDSRAAGCALAPAPGRLGRRRLGRLGGHAPRREHQARRRSAALTNSSEAKRDGPRRVALRWPSFVVRVSFSERSSWSLRRGGSSSWSCLRGGRSSGSCRCSTPR